MTDPNVVTSKTSYTFYVCIFQLSESDQELYKNFPLVVSERWQEEIAETIFDYINQETDKIEQKRKQKVLDELEDSCESYCKSRL